MCAHTAQHNYQNTMSAKEMAQQVEVLTMKAQHKFKPGTHIKVNDTHV